MLPDLVLIAIYNNVGDGNPDPGPPLSTGLGLRRCGEICGHQTRDLSLRWIGSGHPRLQGRGHGGERLFDRSKRAQIFAECTTSVGWSGTW